MDVLPSKEREREKTGAFVVLLFLVEDDDNLIEKNVLILLFSSFLFQLVFLGLFFFHFIIILFSQHKNLLKHTKGFRGRSKNCFRVAIRRLQKSWQYGYRDRRVKRREWSKFWIQKIQAGVRQYSWRYSQFMGSYKQSGMKLDKKVSL